MGIAFIMSIFINILNHKIYISSCRSYATSCLLSPVCRESKSIWLKMSTRSEKEKSKAQQEKFQAVLSNLLKDDDNKYCVDCDAKGYFHLSGWLPFCLSKNE